jgi:hypothetical protein
MVVVAARDHFATFDEDGTEGEAHRALGSRIGTLREVKLRLVHDRWTRQAVRCLGLLYGRQTVNESEPILIYDSQKGVKW